MPLIKHVTGPQEIEQAAALRPLSELGLHTGHAMVRHNLIDLEPCRLGLGALVIDGLVHSGDSGIENCLHGTPLSAEMVSI
jgi:hypothetical protein